MYCPSGKIVNPLTGRSVNKHGKIGKKLSSSRKNRSSQKKSLKKRSLNKRKSPYASDLIEANLRVKSKTKRLSKFEQSELKDMQWLNSL